MHKSGSTNTTGPPLISCACRPPSRCPVKTSSVCRTNRDCFFYRERDASGEIRESLGCYSDDKNHHLLYCRTKMTAEHALACCKSDMCNERLDPQFKPTTAGSLAGDRVSGRNPTIFDHHRGNVAMAIVVPVLILVVLLGMMMLLWRFVLRPRLKKYALKATAGAGKAKSACTSVSGRDLLLPGVGAAAAASGQAGAPAVDGSSSLRAQHVGESTLHRLYDISCSSGSGSGLPFLVQRTVARQVSLIECIGKGRYGEVWRGDYHGEPVAVKIFSSREEASWSRETEMYNTLLLRHENILGYFASDMTSRYGCTQLWLITHYHPLGSLFDYLNACVVGPEAGLALMYSAAAGLCHLHTEIFGCQGKPGIAHRDVKSKNILVRVNGSCCIADLGLSVTYSQSSDELNMGRCASVTPAQMPNNKVGTKRYMSPEILTESHCAPGLSKAAAFELLKAADVYALALVIWEICRRCVTDGVADEYLIPFSGRVPADPTYEQMKAVVCDRRERPPCSPRWRSHAGLTKVTRLLSEGWHAQPDVRLGCLRVKKTLGRILDDSREERRVQMERARAESVDAGVVNPTVDANRQAFCESSCEDASLSFCGSSSQSSNSLLHSGAALIKTPSGGKAGYLAASPGVCQLRQPPTEASLTAVQTAPDATLVPLSGATVEDGEEETTDPSSVKLLLPHSGISPINPVSCESEQLLSSAEETSTEKKAIIEQLMV